MWQTPTAFGGNDPWTRYYAPFPNGSLSLVLAGCGHPATRIPLDGAPFPQVSATADLNGSASRVTWTTDSGVSDALLTPFAGEYGELCHTQSTSTYTFNDVNGGMNVEVESVAGRMDIVTAFGPATVWRAGVASATLPPPPP